MDTRIVAITQFTRRVAEIVGMSLLLLIGCDSGANVPSPTLTSCDSKLISSFETLDHWQVINNVGNASLDPVAFEGSWSLRLVTSPDGLVAIGYVLPVPLDLSTRALTLMVLTDDPLAVSSLRITLKVRSNMSSFREITYPISEGYERQLDKWDAGA